MSGTTTNYGWTYPSEGDAPDGAAQMQTIAVAADSTVHGIDVRVATLEGHDANKPPVAYGASGTFTATQAGHAVYLKITCVNGGGGAGGCATTGAATCAVSGGGAGGATSVKTVAVAGLTFPLQVNVGAVGAGGTSGANAGGTGGTSSVIDNNGAGSTLCSGGAHNSNQGGQGGPAVAVLTSGATIGFDGTTSGAVSDYFVPGGPAVTGIVLSTTAAFAQKGGDSTLGHGGYGGANATGHAGFGFGGGGGGASSHNTAAFAGAAGSLGTVIIEPQF